MRILYCNKYNFPFSGTEKYLFELMDLMRAHGHEVALFSMADPRGQATEYDEHFVPHIDFKNGGQGPATRLKHAFHAIYSWQARRKLRAIIRAFRPDVAHVRNIYHHLSPSILWELKAQGIPVLFHLNDFKLLCPSCNMVAHGRACQRCQGGRFWHVTTEGCYVGPPAASLVLAAEAYVHKWLGTYRTCVDQFLAPSHFVKQKLLENGYAAEKIEVLPHFQRLPLPPPIAAPDAPILYFGRLSQEKGVRDLLCAAQHLPNHRFVIAGDGPQRPELERLTVHLRLRNLEFVGHTSGATLDELIATSRFTVFPSLAFETLGKSILESYAWGRAVVASDLGSRREFVHEGKTGLLFPPGNVKQLAEALSFLATRPELCARMGAAGRKLVHEHHSPEAHYLALRNLYARLAPASRNPLQPAEPANSDPRLRVAFIGGRGVISKYSGIETFYEEVGKRLVEAGHEVTVYCRSYFTPPQPKQNGIHLVRLPTLRSKHWETPIHTFLSTVHAMTGGCEIVHYQCLGPALFSFLPRLVGKKTVVTVQGLDWKRSKWGRTASAVLRMGEWASIRLPSATTVVSRTLQAYYHERYGLDPTYIPNGTSLRQPGTISLLPAWGLDLSSYVLFLGRFSPEKNCDLLIDAYEKIDTPVKLVLAGGASHSSAYVEKLRRHESDRIRFLDWVSGEALDELITNAMLFVLPSDLEGLSLALLDAMGAGVCVLASDVPENREVLDGVGFCFRRGDARDLERMLRYLISATPERQAAGERARQRIRENYLWDDVAREVEQFYRQLAGRKPPAPAGITPFLSSKPRPRSDRAA